MPRPQQVRSPDKEEGYKTDISSNPRSLFEVVGKTTTQEQNKQKITPKRCLFGKKACLHSARGKNKRHLRHSASVSRTNKTTRLLVMFKALPNMLFTVLLVAVVSVSAAPAAPTKAAIAPRIDEEAPAPTAEPEPTIDCHYRYCESSTSWCFYWAGVTGYDISLGPIPGETRTSIGTCDPATEVGPEPTITIPPL